MVRSENTQEKKVDAGALAQTISQLPEKQKLIVYGYVEGMLATNETAPEKAAV